MNRIRLLAIAKSVIVGTPLRTHMCECRALILETATAVLPYYQRCFKCGTLVRQITEDERNDVENLLAQRREHILEQHAARRRHAKDQPQTASRRLQAFSD